MIALNILCDLFWLLWLLPALLGALLWWLGTRKYNGMVAEYESKVSGLNSRISGLQGDLSECGNKRAELEGDLALTKGRMREMETEMKTLEVAASKQKSNNSNGDDSQAKYNKMVADYDSKIDGLNGKVSGLTGDLSDCKSKNEKLESNLSDVKGQMKKLESDSAEAIAKAKSNISSGSDSANLGAIASSLVGGSGDASSGITSEGDSDSEATSVENTGSAMKSIYSGVKNDNLQIIEGIGPKMELVLKENGVSNHADLAAKSPSEIQAILDKYGDKYKIIDSTTWAQQAGYAAKADYDGLIDLQKKLDTGKDNAVGMTDSKLEKYLIKTGALKSFKQDDLKAIEGIGPATEKLLHENGIKTWRELANSDADSIKAILKAAGSRFALGDPTTWPKQAELAADGEFDKLREYQDFLDGGKG